MNLKDYIELNGECEIIDVEALEKCLEPKKPKTIYEIKKGDPYFILNINGDILAGVWDDYETEKAYRSMGFAFLTEEEAEIRKKMLLIEEELIRLGGRREFKLLKDNYSNTFWPERNSISYSNSSRCVQSEIHFDTQEQVKEAVKQIGKQRLIDEYFKPRIVEEDQE